MELAADRAAVETCLRSLSVDEKARASQFRLQQLKTAFILSHGILRVLIGRYVDISPDRLVFTPEPRGKPRLTFPEAELKFNMAHSGKFAAYAFAVGCEIGIDIEKIRPLRDQEGIVRRFFSREECEDWLSLGFSKRAEAFFRCWTQKEAFIKAVGDGLARPLDSFRVSLRPEEPAGLIHVAGDTDASDKWSLKLFAPAEGYVSAVAVPEPQCKFLVVPRLTASGLLDAIPVSERFPPTAA